jgi:hypothetical protein
MFIRHVDVFAAYVADHELRELLTDRGASLG